MSLLGDVRRAYGVHCGFLALNTEIASIPDSAYTSASQRPAPKQSDFSDYWKSLPDALVAPRTTASASGTELSEAGLEAGLENQTSELGRNLGEEDVRRMKTFLREFAVQSLVPWMERNVSQWNEQVSSLFDVQ